MATAMAKTVIARINIIRMMKMRMKIGNHIKI